MDGKCIDGRRGIWIATSVDGRTRLVRITAIEWNGRLLFERWLATKTGSALWHSHMMSGVPHQHLG